MIFQKADQILFEFLTEQTYQGRGIPQDGKDGHYLRYDADNQSHATDKCIAALIAFITQLRQQILTQLHEVQYAND